MSRDDAPFYVGYRPRADVASARFLRRVAVVLVVSLIGVVGSLVALLPRSDAGVFEWGTVRTFDGVVRTTPVPRLEIDVPGARAPRELLLVGAFKHGAGAIAAPFDGRRVRARGTLIHRGEAAMLEVGDAAFTDLGAAPASAAPTPLGDVVLRGEIVDSKCYLGVMKPGHRKPHRDCAVRCISGGVPPLLMVRDAAGNPTYHLLIGKDGESVNAAVLDYVAEPVEVTGALERHGGLTFLRIDAATQVRRIPEDDVR